MEGWFWFFSGIIGGIIASRLVSAWRRVTVKGGWSNVIGQGLLIERHEVPWTERHAKRLELANQTVAKFGWEWKCFEVEIKAEITGGGTVNMPIALIDAKYRRATP